jgi:MFS transporter, CP family, cyanate transporter
MSAVSSAPGKPVSPRTTRLPLAVGVILIAANLRPAMAATATVLDPITDDLELSTATVGALTTLPVLLFGLAGVSVPRLVRRFGVEAALGLVLVSIVAAATLWLEASVVGLFGGTLLFGAAAAVGNVLLPVVIRRNFPDQVGLMSGLYTAALMLAAAVAAAVTVPLGDASGRGWSGGLAFWGLPALVALGVWVWQMKRTAVRSAPHVTTGTGGGPLLRDRLAWQITGLMGLSALSFHTTLAWLPSVFSDAGLDASTAGVLLAVTGFVAVPVALVLPAFAARRPTQGPTVAILAGLAAIGLLGLLVAPTAAPYLWVTFLGLGQGPIFPLTLTIIVLRSRTAGDTVALSTMAQSIGYVIGAAGPLTFGLLHSLTGTWSTGITLLLLLLIPQVWCGIGAGRARYVG